MSRNLTPVPKFCLFSKVAPQVTAIEKNMLQKFGTAAT